jgi:acyl-CoA reductase-like NAD-dependent aldehyde dehydrogenase
LGAGLVTSNLNNAMKIINGLRVGTVYVNCYEINTESTVFGGFKDSGIGRELGPYGIEEYLEKKNVVIKLPDDARL